MFEIFIPLALIYYNTAISLGVGASTIVIASFMVALSDGKIDVSERRMLGVIYITLRVAMVSILAMLMYISLVVPSLFSTLLFLWPLVGVLYVNAILMTKHWISPKFGPAIQAATWYTLGFVTVIDTFGLYEVSVNFFLMLYAVDFVTALFLVNGLLLWFGRRRG